MRHLAAGLVLLTLAAASGVAQATNEQPRQPIFRSGASLVALSVTVTGPDREFVSGLRAEDFAVYEDGVEQDIRFFETRQIPIDLIVLIDTSSSMRHQMNTVHTAAEGLIQTLREGDRGAIVSFNDRVDIVQDLTSDRDALVSAIRTTGAKGGTALYNALYISLKQFGQAARTADSLRRQAIVVLSDGEDTASLIDFDDVMQIARKSGVTVYPIALDPELAGAPTRRYYSTADYAVRQLARETGAEAFVLKKVVELRGVYATIAAELSSQYSIGYAPSNIRPDGRFRRIAVRVVSRPDLRTRARTGYIAEAERTALLPDP